MADRITFTKSSGDRIAKVVRIVEAGNRDTDILPTAPRFGLGGGGGVKFVSWTSTWTINATATIEFVTNSLTATATNVFLGVSPGEGWVARKGTTGWALIGCDLTLQPEYEQGDNQLFGHTTSGLCRWYSVTTCATATASG